MSIPGRIYRRLRQLFPSGNGSYPSLSSFSESLTSSDGNYLGVCRMAVLDVRVFADFRRNPAYTTVLEHVSGSQGKEYLSLLSADGRAVSGLAEAAKNDVIVNPVNIRLESGLLISPTTLRYLKVADDIEKLFGNLDGADVVEIGVGYGGQCRILDSLFRLKSYTLVDLRPVLNLAAEFLAQFPLRTTVRFLTMNELEPRSYDFLVSNYAFTELTRVLQETYYRKAFEGTPRGYISYNAITPPEYHSFSPDELCQLLGASTFPEKPLTHPRNCIIAWGTGGRVLV